VPVNNTGDYPYSPVFMVNTNTGTTYDLVTAGRNFVPNEANYFNWNLRQNIGLSYAELQIPLTGASTTLNFGMTTNGHAPTSINSTSSVPDLWIDEVVSNTVYTWPAWVRGNH
jgi:hypothetical protein